MPVLKSYTDCSGYYIHASVHGAVVTFQTTQRGVEKLTEAGVQPGIRFALRLLADLTRTGDAYTRHGGVEFYEAEQFEFDFKESQESAALFPACAVTGTFDAGGERVGVAGELFRLHHGRTMLDRSPDFQKKFKLSHYRKSPSSTFQAECGFPRKWSEPSQWNCPRQSGHFRRPLRAGRVDSVVRFKR